MLPKVLYPVGFMLLLVPAQSQDYEGAGKFLERLNERVGESGETSADPVTNLRARLATFKLQVGKMPPEQAARTWLGLFQTFLKIPSQLLNDSNDYAKRLGFDSLIMALPPSSAWGALEKEIAGNANDTLSSGQQAALGLLMAALREGPDHGKAAIDKARTVFEERKGTQNYQETSLKEFVKLMRRREGMEIDRIQEFREALDSAEGESSSSYLTIPPLPANSPESTGLIMRALKAGGTLEVEDGPTREMVIKTALANPDSVKSPLWGLITTAEDIPLYEVLKKRFPKENENSWQLENANGIYLASLIGGGKRIEAGNMVLSLLGSNSDGTVKSGLAAYGKDMEVLRDFLRDLLGAAPVLPLWDCYLNLPVSMESLAAKLRFVEQCHGGLEEGTAAKDALGKELRNLQLEMDQINAPLAAMHSIVVAGPGAVPEKSITTASQEDMKKKLENLGLKVPERLMLMLANPGSSGGSRVQGYYNTSVQLIRIGKLMDKPEWIRDGLAGALEVIPLLDGESWSQDSNVTEIAQLLVDSGRGPEAEKLIGEWIARLCGNGRKPDDKVIPYLACLASIYAKAGRADDMLQLFDQCRFWCTDELGKLARVNAAGEPLLVIAGRAFLGQGKKDLATKAVRRCLEESSGNDSSYALLLEIGEADTEAFLDRLYANDRFEERPLIWKAKLQLDAGRVAEAEKTIKEAIAIDPSDGEQGKNDRMRAYSVLGEISTKKGDAKEAGLMGEIVAAIRISEKAYDWWGSGMTGRAVKMYEEALRGFSDAYCIQSRLAMRYSETGETAKAEEHYQKAFELMPDSFGRVESHCFGCEGIFSGDTSQGIADRVFTRLAKERPDSPRVFYLLGYLRDSQGRDQEAAEAFLKAVALDPDYLNAWKKLSSLEKTAGITPAQRDEIGLNILRLAPSTADVDGVGNLGKLWDSLLAVESTRTAPTDGLVYPLAASKPDPRSSYNRSQDEFGYSDPRRKFTSNDIVGSAIQVMEYLQQAD